MIYFYSANTKNLKWYKKPFSYSWWIKVFTSNERPEGMDWEDTPTHVSIGYDETLSGRKLIFESYVVQMLNPYDDPPVIFEFVKNHQALVDKDIFWQIVDAEKMKGYAFLQLIDFIRLWLFNKILKRDPKTVWFPKSSVCSEIGYTCSLKYANKYNLSNTRTRLLKSNSNFYHPTRLLNVLNEAENNGEGIWIKRF